MELSKIKKIYMLYHRSETGDNKLIGFFSTKQKAVEIMNNRKKQYEHILISKPHKKIHSIFKIVLEVD